MTNPEKVVLLFIFAVLMVLVQFMSLDILMVTTTEGVVRMLFGIGLIVIINAAGVGIACSSWGAQTESRMRCKLDLLIAVPELQHLIDAQLEKLAEGFQEACVDESQTIARIHEAGKDPETDAGLKIIRDRLKVRKGAFWGAHRAAKALGYEVMEHHTDYLQKS